MFNKLTTFHHQIVTLVLILLICSCSNTQSTNHFELSSEIAETSGLTCLDGQLWTINDSGNEPIIYQIDRRGEIKLRKALSVTNTDWEAITSFNNDLFIGDIGNNAGTRKSFNLIKVSSPTSAKPVLQQWQVHFPKPPPAHVIAYNHDFDAEALVAISASQLLLFTKSWQTDISHVYQVDLNNASSISMQKIGEVQGLPGLITDVTLNARTGDFVVVGYQNYRRHLMTFIFTRSFVPFIATLDRQFNIQSIDYFPEDAQVEGITECAGFRWISAEKSDSSAARLWRGVIQ